MMAEQAYESPSLNTSNSELRAEHTSTSPHSAPSPTSGETSTTLNTPRQRKQSSMSPNDTTAPIQSARQRQKAKTLPAKGRGDSSRGSMMTMPGLLDQAGEITYTPTTHRISKAKKGKKVHACEYPGCTKVPQHDSSLRLYTYSILDIYPCRASQVC